MGNLRKGPVGEACIEETRKEFGWIGSKRRKESRKSRKIMIGKDCFKKKTN
jgi:hypothetical protein